MTEQEDKSSNTSSLFVKISQFEIRIYLQNIPILSKVQIDPFEILYNTYYQEKKKDIVVAVLNEESIYQLNKYFSL